MFQILPTFFLEKFQIDILIPIISLSAFYWLLKSMMNHKPRETQAIQLVSVNYHFTRKCNYSCGFCFHTSKTSHVESLENSKRIIKSLRDEGCKKINFAGGEPFLPEYRQQLGEMVKYAKEECCYESVSIISNGSHVKEEWFIKYHQYLDILGISCDSSNEGTNEKIGRGKGSHVEHVKRAAYLCRKYNVKFKLNTVVNRFNCLETMASLVNELKPMRWKIFQVLPLEGENTGEASLRDVTPFLISDQEFQQYIARNTALLLHPSIAKVEDNCTMQASYVLVDELGRFLDSSTGSKVPTQSILQVGVREALSQLAASAGGGFDQQAFCRRDGMFDREWSKQKTAAAPTVGGECGSASGPQGGEGGVLVDVEDLVLPGK